MSKYLLTNLKMYPTEQNKITYSKFLDFKKSFFEDGVSFFDKNIKLFDDDEVFNEFEKRIIKNYDDSDLDNKTKYLNQLLNSSKKMRHFFANIIWLYNYPIYDTQKTTKTNDIKDYLGTYYKEDLINIKIDNIGIASYGMLKISKYYDINLIYFFTKKYIKTKNNPNEILNNINLYELMKAISKENFDNKQSLASRHILNYLFDPDKYEPIVNTRCKENIAIYFNKEVNEKTLDEVLLQIRNEGFGFNESLYDKVCGEQSLSKNNNIKIKDIIILDNKEYNFSLIQKNFAEDDLFKKEQTKVENGKNAELLVYESIKDNVNIKVLGREINDLFSENRIMEIHSKIDKLIHYSKNFNKFAPFDLISTRGEELIYIEVKSTTGNEIYFSINEIKFAYNHIDNYQVNIVKDEIIYELDISNLIIEIYNSIIDNNPKWSFETIKLKLDFNSQED